MGPPPPVTPPPPPGAPSPVSTAPVEGSDQGSDTKDAAKEEASKVADSAKEQATKVAGTAREEVQHTAGEAKRQAQELWRRSQSEVSTQAGEQQQRLASGLRSFSAEMGQMADGAEEPGVATQVARWASQLTDDAGRWLEDRDPSSVLDEVQRYARRHPGTFMLIAAGLGLAAGRVARSLKDSGDEDSGSATGTSGGSVGGGSAGGPTGTTTGSPVGYSTGSPTGATTGTAPGYTYGGSDQAGGVR